LSRKEDECKPLLTGAGAPVLAEAALSCDGAIALSADATAAKFFGLPIGAAAVTVTGQGFTLVHYSAQLELFLTQKHTLNTPNTSCHPLNTP
jgi:hypothetical protein